MTKANKKGDAILMENMLVRVSKVLADHDDLLKTVAFIDSKSVNQAAKLFFSFSIDNLFASVSFYALSWPKLNFGCYLTSGTFDVNSKI